MTYYNMTEGPPGKCFIYNFEEYTDGRKNVNWAADKQKIEDVFGKLGYTVEDKCAISTKSGILNDLEQFAVKDHKEENSFVCFILTHGKKNNILQTSDYQHIDLVELIEIVGNCKTLEGKPKIFVVTACRGDERDNGKTFNQAEIESKVDDHFSLFSTKPDFLIIFPTSPNHLTFYDPEYGTTFIDMLTTAIKKHGTRSTMTELLQRLIYAMNCVPVFFEGKLRINVPCYISTMQRTLVLSQIGTSTHNHADLQIKYSEEDCVRTRLQALLQHAKENNVPIYDSPDSTEEESKQLKFSDYCYLLDESTGCYDTRQDRKCIVINAILNEGAFGIGKDDAKMIVEKMTEMKFVVQTFPEDNDRSHDTLMKYITKGKVLRDICKKFFYEPSVHVCPADCKFSGRLDL